MRKTLPGWVRWPLVCALALALLVLLPVAWVLKHLSGGTLWIAEKATDAFNDLRTGGE